VKCNLHVCAFVALVKGDNYRIKLKGSKLSIVNLSFLVNLPFLNSQIVQIRTDIYILIILKEGDS